MAVNGGNKRVSSMENLPHELVIEILSWLPTKHLSPLRFVSKSWLELLTKNPQFAKLQFDRFIKSNPNPSLVATKPQNETLLLATDFESCDKAVTLQLPFYQATNYPRLHLSGNCNGLLCFLLQLDKEVYIWNPIINDHITFSCPPAPSKRFRGIRCSSTTFGFGFDQHSNVYKVVRFFNENDFTYRQTRMQINVYTIGVDSMWRTVQLDLPSLLMPLCRVKPVVNGVLHWIACGMGDLIYTFDLKREVIGELLPPPCVIEFDDIAELAGLLCVVDNANVSEMHIWVMKEYGQVSSWSKQYVIGIPEEFVYHHRVPLGLTDNGVIIMKIKGGKLALYSPETNTVRDLNTFPDAIDLPYAYIGSIISPTAISRAGHNLLQEES